MFKKLLSLLVFSIFGLMFFVRPISVLADDDPTDLGELISEPEDNGETTQSSSDGSGSEFDTSEYKGYNNRGYDDFEDKFYVTPLKNVTEGVMPPGSAGMSDPVKVYKDLREELAKTGYEAYCMIENVEIEPEYSTPKLIERFLYYHPDGVGPMDSARELDTISTEKLGTNNAEYPIWRDVDDKQFLMTSLEEYFGFKDLIEEDPAKSEITTAPINSLLSQQQSCVQGWKSMAAQRRACNRLYEQDTCALTKRKIPGSGYEMHDLMGMTANFYSRHTGGSWAGANEAKANDRAVEGCSILFANQENRTLELNNEEKNLKLNIINVLTYHDKSYRIGFLVAAIETISPDKTEENPREATSIFNFFTNAQTSKAEPGDEVLVAAFKLPDIGTNKGPQSNYGHEQFDDPLDLTRLAITTKDQQTLHDEARDEKRGFTLAAAESAAYQTDASRVHCHEGAFPGEGTQTCLLPLPKALTDIINGTVTNESCEKNSEVVNYISDLAGLRDPSDTYGKVFKESSGGQVLLNLFYGSPYNADGTSPGYAEVDINSIFTIADDTWGPAYPGSVVHFYLVYPVGFELATVEEAIKGAFFTTDQIAKMNEDSSIVNTFEMTGQTQTLDGGEVGWRFEDYEKTAEGKCGYNKYDPPFDYLTNYNDPIPCIEKPSIKIVQDGGKVDILGGRLSWWLRKVQVALSSSSSFARSYYDSCKTMEEFLLGKCGGEANGSEVNPEDLESVAQCIEGGPRITSGETAEHISIIGTGVCAGKPTMTFSPLIHNIPNWKNAGDTAPTCDEAFYSYVACTYPETLIANPVNDQGQFIESGSLTACEFVVSEAMKKGISPRLALAMWGEETGFSHYKSSNGAFGIHPGVADPFHLGEQVSALAGTMFGQVKYQSFLEKYSAEVIGSNQFCTNPEFPARLATYYYYLSP